jgi:hypothetical protein
MLAECRTTTSSEDAAALEESERLYHEGLGAFRDQRYGEALQQFAQATKKRCSYHMAVYYLGLTYGKLGCYQQAIRPLEQALVLMEKLPTQAGKSTASHPGVAAVYHDLAVAHARLGHHQEAAIHFGKAEAADAKDGLLPDNNGVYSYRAEDYAATRAAIEREKQARQVQKRWQLRVGIGTGFDSNVILQPDDGPTVGQISDKDDFRFTFSAGGKFDWWRNDIAHVTTDYDFYQSLYTDIDKFDLQAHRFRLIGGWQYSDDLFLEAEGGTNYYRLGDDDYLHEFYGMPSLGYFPCSWAYTAVSYRLIDQNYLFTFFDPARNGLRQELAVRQYFLWKKPKDFNHWIFIGYQHVINNPSLRVGNDFQYTANLFEVGVRTPIPIVAGASAELVYSFRSNDYTFAHSRTNFKRARDDDIHDISLILRKRLSPYVTINVSYFGTLNDSNISVFEYDRHMLSVGVQLTY